MATFKMVCRNEDTNATHQRPVAGLEDEMPDHLWEEQGVIVVGHNQSAASLQAMIWAAREARGVPPGCDAAGDYGLVVRSRRQGHRNRE